MSEFLRILRLLIYKNLLIYKRQWYVVLIGHLIIPISILMVVNLTPRYDPSSENEVPATTYPKVSKQEINSYLKYRNYTVYFAPDTNSFIKTMIDQLPGCLYADPNSLGRFDPLGFPSEEELLVHIQNENETLYQHVALIFEDNINESTKHLKYKIRSDNFYMTELYALSKWFDPIYYFTQSNRIVQLQICLDETFIKLKAENAKFPEISVQRAPYPAYSKSEVVNTGASGTTACILVVVALIIPLVIEISKVVREKLSGVNVLMSMNGVSTTSTLLSWLITGWIFISIFCIIPLICILTVPFTSNARPVLKYGNVFIFWVVIEIYIIHLLAYGMHACQYFSKYIIFTFCFLMLNVSPSMIENFSMSEESLFIVPYLGILFPNLLIYRAMDELVYYENLEEGIQWKNMFTAGNSLYKVGGSIGMILILSIIGIVFQFFMAIYINAINPGKYGTKKHPLFLFKAKTVSNDQNNLENVEYNEMNSEYFEAVPSNIYSSGIQIRNLKKTYNVGLINKKRIEALRGVSMNFYKGQITSLLGHNGAGKTTMMSILTGMMSPSEGSVIVNSLNIQEFQTEVMNDMGLCPQEDMFFPNLTIEEQFTFFAKLKGKDKSAAEITQNVTLVLEKLKLSDKRNTLPNKLSGGQKRRLCFGMAIAGNPSTLVLDEPTSGLDPESRRVIWDILLKMRGQKTILISTHDMEEADVLGDRIAIIHKGKLKSYGTPMFMKKLLGQGNLEVTLSVESGFSFERIRDVLNCEVNVVSEDSGKIILTIPNSPSAPDSLDNIQQKKKELGITGFSVSLISLEQVFLKISEESNESKKSSLPVINTGEKLTGSLRAVQILNALFRKKLLYTIYNLPIIFSVLFWMLISLLFISLALKYGFNVNPQTPTMPISLDMYKNPITFYQSYDRLFEQHYKNITEKYGGFAIDANMLNITEIMMKFAEKNRRTYDKRVLAAVEFNNNETHISANAIFSDTSVYSFPISINLMSNALLKTLVNSDYSISMSYQKLLASWMYYSDQTTPMITGYSTAFIFSFFLFTAIALFAVHPRQEALTDVKQLQRMTGASTFFYWGTMFIFDFVVLLLIILIIIWGFSIMSSTLELQMYGETEIQIFLLSTVLFIINALPILYSFSFTKLRVTSVVKILIYGPLIFVILEVVRIVVYLIYIESRDEDESENVKVAMKILDGIFLMIPYISFLDCQISFHLTAQKNSRCKILSNSFYDVKCRTTDVGDYCCNLNCYDGKCEKSLKYFEDDGNISLKTSLIYMGITTILYFAILVVLDNQLFKKLIAKLKKPIIPEYSMDEKVKYEKSLIAQKISEKNIGQNNSREFLVYELRKRYAHLLAVKDVSFGVNSGECFGLLGVNGAGKSTTFRMMTGTEVPDHGEMYMDQKSWTHNADYFFSRMGYCPQNDALIKCLNSYDHLRLFARLRGVPENSVEVEVKTWVQRLNLSSCASNPCGTYSGGNKRRLNIAIALIGNPDLVLLDEPTTGVDPGARRSLWNVIQSCQALGQAVILTSHSMEECEALCNRLAIMVDGRFVCIGQSQELKQRFGAGYDIRLKMNPEKSQTQLDQIKDYMRRALNCELVDENMGYLMYHVKSVETTWREMYDAVNAIKDRCDCIDDFSVLSSTLEQLFLLFARAADGNASSN